MHAGIYSRVLILGNRMFFRCLPASWISAVDVCVPNSLVTWAVYRPITFDVTRSMCRMDESSVSVTRYTPYGVIGLFSWYHVTFGRGCPVAWILKIILCPSCGATTFSSFRTIVAPRVFRISGGKKIFFRFVFYIFQRVLH